MQLGLPNVIPIDFGSGSNKRGYANKRAQMWGDLKRWLEQGGFIPDDKELVKELISVQYRFKATNNDLILEEKEKLKKSPDSGDAISLFVIVTSLESTLRVIHKGLSISKHSLNFPTLLVPFPKTNIIGSPSVSPPSATSHISSGTPDASSNM
jgi:hypothetical protein